MNIDQRQPAQTTRPLVEILRIVLGTIAALAAVTLLVINILAFLEAVKYYQAMGYPLSEVYKQMVPSQLLPGIFEPIAVYGGIAFLLFYIGGLKHRVTTLQAGPVDPDAGENAPETKVLSEIIDKEENSAGAEPSEKTDGDSTEIIGSPSIT